MTSLDDDVSALLQSYDALDAFLREVDVLDVKFELPAPPISPISSVSSTSSAPRKRKHKHSGDSPISAASTAGSESLERPVRRRRQKEELLQLRQQALEMEAQLQSLQSALSVAQPRKAAAGSLESQLWEGCALHERRAKHVVEDENARLRGIASKEFKVSLEIEKLLVKCYASALAFVSFEKNEELVLEARDLFLYEMLEQNADARFRSIDSANFEFAAPAAVHGTGHESRIVLTGNRETGVEFKRSQLFPFDADSVNEVSWDTIVNDDHKMFAAKNVRRIGDTIAIHARFTVHREREGEIHLDAHNVIKRFRRKGRTTVTWEGMTQWSVAGAAALCLPTRETGWGVLEPVAGAARVTKSHFCSATLATKPQGVAASEANLLRELIIPSLEQLMLAHHQIMENALLDASLRGRC